MWGWEEELLRARLTKTEPLSMSWPLPYLTFPQAGLHEGTWSRSRQRQCAL